MRRLIQHILSMDILELMNKVQMQSKLSQAAVNNGNR